MLLHAIRSSLFPAVAGFCIILSSGCQTLNEDPEGPPTITDEMPLSEAVDLGIRHGSVTWQQLLGQIKARKASAGVREMLEEKILNDEVGTRPDETFRLIYLYQFTGNGVSLEVLRKLIRSGVPLQRQLGFQLAARSPSAGVRKLVENELSRSIWKGEEKRVLVPEMAIAARTNQLTEAYTLVRRGLMEVGGVEFARTMIDLNSEEATGDFMNYLAIATIEDLRQMNQVSVDVPTCMLILSHFIGNSVPVTHPKFDHLFLYAVSRNLGLAELARKVLEKEMGMSREHLAFTLARMPVWIQVAWVEGSRDNLSPNLGLFMAELKKATSHAEVVDEINSLRL